MIGAAELAAMRPGTVLINTARGALVDSSALLRALECGHLAGAALDVLDREHRIANDGHPLIDYARRHDNLPITPHIGGATHESVEKTDLYVLHRFLRWAGIEPVGLPASSEQR
ncbi:MAG: hypothetical protein IH986_14180 [Planctomycetes bacterium]|nr:hypothetical protein [Planctomycetota bacterium]